MATEIEMPMLQQATILSEAFRFTLVKLLLSTSKQKLGSFSEKYGTDRKRLIKKTFSWLLLNGQITKDHNPHLMCVMLKICAEIYSEINCKIGIKMSIYYCNNYYLISICYCNDHATVDSIDCYSAMVMIRFQNVAKNVAQLQNRQHLYNECNVIDVKYELRPKTNIPQV